MVSFSVITPIYNAEPFVESIRSITSQSSSNFEVILVDDCSSDCSAQKIYNALYGSIPSITLLSTLDYRDASTPRGPWLARNLAIDSSSCDYLCFHDVDDIWLPQRLSNLHDYISSHPTSDFLYSNVIKSNSSLSKFYPKPSLPCIPPRLQLYIWNPFVMSSIVINRSSLASIRFSLFGMKTISLFSTFSVPYLALNALLSTHLTVSTVFLAHLYQVIKFVIPWWFACYSYFNLPIFLSIPFFSLKLIAEVIESYCSFPRFTSCSSSSSNLIKMISITGTNGFISRRLALEFSVLVLRLIQYHFVNLQLLKAFLLLLLL